MTKKAEPMTKDKYEYLAIKCRDRVGQHQGGCICVGCTEHSLKVIRSVAAETWREAGKTLRGMHVCDCGPAYKDRKLTSPSCQHCEDDMIADEFDDRAKALEQP